MQTVLLISWLQLVLAGPVDCFIDFMFDTFILAPSYLAIEDQRKLLENEAKNSGNSTSTVATEGNSTSITNSDDNIKVIRSSKKLRRSNISITNDSSASAKRRDITSSSSRGGSKKRNSANSKSSKVSPATPTTASPSTIIANATEIKSTLLVTKEFVNRRYKMIVDLLNHRQQYHQFSVSTSDDDSIYRLYQSFKTSFLAYRQSLPFNKRVTLDEAWEPFFEDQYVDTSAITITANDTSSSTSAILKKYSKTSSVILKEMTTVNLLGKDFCKELEAMPPQVIITITIIIIINIITIIIIIIISCWVSTL